MTDKYCGGSHRVSPSRRLRRRAVGDPLDEILEVGGVEGDFPSDNDNDNNNNVCIYIYICIHTYVQFFRSVASKGTFLRIMIIIIIIIMIITITIIISTIHNNNNNNNNNDNNIWIYNCCCYIIILRSGRPRGLSSARPRICLLL